ncbi:MAG: TolC family outer membrane protein [Oleiphilaceae bacterium]|nr:TolC family outer membrane protein [Oleiphilaceae bacterium]
MASPTTLGLVSLYRLALEHDASLAAARHRRDAGLEARAQGRAGLLPEFRLSGEYARGREWAGRPGPSGEVVQAQQGFTNARYQASLTQPLFRLDAWYGYREGRAGARVAQLEFEQRLQRFNGEFLEAYLEAMGAQVTVRTLDSRVEAALAQAHQASARLQAGLASRLDVSEARAELKTAELELVRARSAEHAALQALAGLTGHFHPGVAALADRFDPRQHTHPPLDRLLEAGRLRNKRVRLLEAATERARLQRKAVMADFAPSLDLTLTASHEQNALEGNAARGGLRDNQTESVVVGIQFSMPLFSGGHSVSAYRQARAEQEEAHEKRREALTDARETIRVNVRNLHSLRQAVSAAEVSVATEEERVLATEQALASGIRDTVDVLRAQRSLYGARREYEQARIDYLAVLGRLHQQTGTMNRAFLQKVNGWLQGEA